MPHASGLFGPARMGRDREPAARDAHARLHACRGDSRPDPVTCGSIVCPGMGEELRKAGRPAARRAVPDVRRVAAFRAALREFDARTSAVTRNCGLTPQRYLLLLMVKGTPDGEEQATISELALRLFVGQTTVSDLVTRAVDAGLLRRCEHPTDARATLVRLTQEGERRLACALRGLRNDRVALAAALSSADQLLEALDDEPSRPRGAGSPRPDPF